MAKTPEAISDAQPAAAEVPAAKPKSKTLKRCECGATVFQGPYQRGEIVDGQMKVRETIFQCVNCHAVKPVTAIADYTIDLS